MASNHDHGLDHGPDHASEQATQQAYHIGYKEDTLKAFELRNVTTCLGYLIPTLESLPQNFSLLDVGCGPGSITFDLARRYPHAKIIGVDIGTQVIERNNNSIATLAPGTGIEFRAGDILNPPSFLSPEEIGAFDIVHEHTTLICIPNNIKVLYQMKQLAKQNGGIVACREGDTHSQIIWPPCRESDELQQRIYEMNGLDTQTGRKLLNKALEVGFCRDEITASASVLSNITALERRLYAGSMVTMLADENSQYRRAATKFGYTDEQVDVLRKNMERLIAADDGWRLTICTEIICRLSFQG
jgi:SAM-dependent methyltransferase